MAFQQHRHILFHLCVLVHLALKGSELDWRGSVCGDIVSIFLTCLISFHPTGEDRDTICKKVAHFDTLNYLILSCRRVATVMQ